MTARSISAASRRSTGVKSTPNDGAAGRLQQWRHGCRASSSQEDVRRERYQFRSVAANTGIAPGPADIDPHVAAVDPAQSL